MRARNRSRPAPISMLAVSDAKTALLLVGLFADWADGGEAFASTVRLLRLRATGRASVKVWRNRFLALIAFFLVKRGPGQTGYRGSGMGYPRPGIERIAAKGFRRLFGYVGPEFGACGTPILCQIRAGSAAGVLPCQNMVVELLCEVADLVSMGLARALSKSFSVSRYSLSTRSRAVLGSRLPTCARTRVFSACRANWRARPCGNETYVRAGQH